MRKKQKRIKPLGENILLIITLLFIMASKVISADSLTKEFINVKDFGVVGDGITDETMALQNAINAAAGKILYISRPPVKYKTNPLWLVSNLKIVFAPGTVIEANKGYEGVRWLKENKGPVADCVFQIQNLDNIFIEGNGSIIQMLKSEYTKGEHRHCVNISSSRNITITDMTLRDW